MLKYERRFAQSRYYDDRRKSSAIADLVEFSKLSLDSTRWVGSTPLISAVHPRSYSLLYYGPLRKIVDSAGYEVQETEEIEIFKR